MARASDSNVKTTKAKASKPAASKPAASRQRASKKAAAEPVQAPPVVSEPVVAQPVEETVLGDGVLKDCLEFAGNLQQACGVLAALKTQFKALEKSVTKELKAAQREVNKRKRKQGTRSPSGFVKPTKISDELASFLGKDTGTEMARTDVTREINAYIREKGLQDPANGRRIIADARLTKLLNLTPADELTYFNLQRYMSPHFAKAAAATK